MRTYALDKYVRGLTTSRRITLQELSRMLGYSSQTSLSRIMQETANYASLLKFSERLRSCDQLALSAIERNQLDDLIELYEIGSDDYETMLKLRQIVRGEQPNAGKVCRLIYPDGSSSSFLAHYAGKKIRSMLLLNSEYAPIFPDLAALLESGDFILEHIGYVKDSAMNTVKTMHSAMPLMYSPRYVARTFSYEEHKLDTPRGLMTSDMLVCEYAHEDGSIRNELIIFDSMSTGQVQPIDYPITSFDRFLPDRKRMRDVRQCISGITIQQYSEFCAKLESGRSVCRLKPDVGLEQIPFDILSRAATDHVPASRSSEIVPVLDALREIQQNAQERSMSQYHIFKRAAMRCFVETGRTCDHLWCCRSYTLQERRQILLSLKEQMLSRHGFHLYFLKDDSVLRDDEITLYEDNGLSIIRAGTNYDMSMQHDEILITQPELLMIFKRFFMESTLRHRVMTDEETMAEMDQLIALCEKECQQELNLS